MKEKENLENTVNEFLEDKINDREIDKEQSEEEICVTKECKMKNGSGLLERVDKKYITNDGRQLLND